MRLQPWKPGLRYGHFRKAARKSGWIRTARGRRERGARGSSRVLARPIPEDAKQPAYSAGPIKHLSSKFPRACARRAPQSSVSAFRYSRPPTGNLPWAKRLRSCLRSYPQDALYRGPAAPRPYIARTGYYRRSSLGSGHSRERHLSGSEIPREEGKEARIVYSREIAAPLTRWGLARSATRAGPSNCSRCALRADGYVRFAFDRWTQ